MSKSNQKEFREEELNRKNKFKHRRRELIEEDQEEIPYEDYRKLLKTSRRKSDFYERYSDE